MAKIRLDELCPCGSGKLYRDCHISMLTQNKSVIIDRSVTLKVIPEPAPNTRTIRGCTDTSSTVIYSSSGNIDLLCGNCKSILFHGASENQISRIVLLCNGCNSYNDT